MLSQLLRRPAIVLRVGPDIPVVLVSSSPFRLSANQSWPTPSERYIYSPRAWLARKAAKNDWYVWVDPKDDGGPNNWLSVFGGPAWSYHPARRKYYFHKFLKSQPKLNWRDPAARAVALDVLRFWLKKGVDGFRLDVANSFLHDDKLRDNPPIPPNLRSAHHWAHAPNMQKRIHAFEPAREPQGSG